MLSSIPGFHEEVDYLFFKSLVLLALCPYRTEADQHTYLEEVQENQKLLKMYADSAPCNFMHRYALVEAEIGRIKNNDMVEVLKNYNLSVTYVFLICTVNSLFFRFAEESGFLCEEGLAKELTAKYQIQIADSFTRQSAKSYTKYNATTKAAKLVLPIC